MSGEFNEEDISRIKQTYRLVPDPEDLKAVCVEILEGPFENVILQFGKVQMKSVADDSDELTAQYEYDIKYVPENIRDEQFTDKEGEDFENMIGDILMAMFYEKAKELEKDKKNAKNRDPNTLTFTT
tara:strand:- start:3593 stop:3973 length:381 start_codon:yes stop_codon:yes gene_type:complete